METGTKFTTDPERKRGIASSLRGGGRDRPAWRRRGLISGPGVISVGLIEGGISERGPLQLRSTLCGAKADLSTTTSAFTAGISPELAAENGALTDVSSMVWILSSGFTGKADIAKFSDSFSGGISSMTWG